ncbi:unnamed protein product, partial [Iphiclides podalirius]
MTTWMALFGLVWLLRVRGSLCGCSACKRARNELQETRELQEPQCSSDPATITSERPPFDVIALQNYTRDASVQTDFDDDDAEDLDKIELQICEGSNVGNYESGREQATQNPEVEHCTTESLQVNDVSLEGAPHSVAVDALQNAGNIVKLRIRRARRPRVVTLWRGVRGLGLGIAGGSDDAAGGGGIFISHIAVGGAAHHDGRLRLGDKILAVRDEDGIETSLIGATHAKAVTALRNTGEHVTLVVLPAASIPPASQTAQLYTTRTQATSCSTLHELTEEEPSNIPRCVRMVRLVRSGSRLGMDIVGGLGGGDSDTCAGIEEEACGVYVSGVTVGGSAYGMLYRGDRILSVDGRDLTRATHEQAAAALKYSGSAVTIAAQYQPEHYERLRARIRAINAAAMSPHRSHATHVPVHPDLHAMYPR